MEPEKMKIFEEARDRGMAMILKILVAMIDTGLTKSFDVEFGTTHSVHGKRYFKIELTELPGEPEMQEITPNNIEKIIKDGTVFTGL